MNKVEITNELLARIYGAYIGCECKIVSKNDPYNQFGEIGLKSRLNWLHIGLLDTVKVKLLLTPLSEITDEDAIEVGKIAFYGADIDDFECKQIDRTKEGVVEIVGNSNLRLCIAAWGNSLAFAMVYDDGNFLPIPEIHAIIDYLRSKSYDCGYGEIPSLIEAGIAINRVNQH